MDSLWYQTLLGYVATQEGNLLEAKERFVEATKNFQKDQSLIGVVFTLEGMADLFMVLGQAEVSVRLIGWADAMREKIPDNRPPVEQSDIDRIITHCIAAIGERSVVSAYEAGKKMMLDEAVAYALEGS
jgi:hypothetical protein